jgi:glycolate oxidase FAD binding subunit
VRLSGSAAGVRAARARLGGELVEKGDAFWEELREHRQIFFQTSTRLWRLSVPPATPMLDLSGKWKLDWGGAQRWLVSDAPDAVIRRVTQQHGGHANPVGGSGLSWQSRPWLPGPLRALHATLKLAFDPAGVLNPAAG